MRSIIEIICPYHDTAQRELVFKGHRDTVNHLCRPRLCVIRSRTARVIARETPVWQLPGLVRAVVPMNVIFAPAPLGLLRVGRQISHKIRVARPFAVRGTDRVVERVQFGLPGARHLPLELCPKGALPEATIGWSVSLSNQFIATMVGQHGSNCGTLTAPPLLRSEKFASEARSSQGPWQCGHPSAVPEGKEVVALGVNRAMALCACVWQ